MYYVEQALLRKMDVLDLDIENFGTKVKETAGLSASLIRKHHFDSENIEHKQVQNIILHRTV